MNDTDIPRGYLNQEQVTERIDQFIERIEHLERAVLLLARHVGAVGWNHELQQALDQLGEQRW